MEEITTAENNGILVCNKLKLANFPLLEYAIWLKSMIICTALTWHRSEVKPGWQMQWYRPSVTLQIPSLKHGLGSHNTFSSHSVPKNLIKTNISYAL